MDDFSLDFDLAEDFDNGDTLDIAEADAVVLELESDLGISDLDFSDVDMTTGSDTPDSDLNFDLTIDDDLGELEASTLLKTEVDISQILLEYSNYVSNIKQKILAATSQAVIKRTMPLYHEFSFISPEKDRQMVYGFFCSMLEDLTTEEKYIDYTEEQAYNVMIDALYNELYYTPNIFENKFRRIFSSFYERNKKLLRAQVNGTVPTLSTLIDKEALERADLVYTINSVPFNWVTRFFQDSTIIPLRATINVSEYGELCQQMRKELGKRTITFEDVLKYIGIFLTSKRTLDLLNLTENQGLEFSIGELLRRYVVYELNSGDFFPTGLEKLVTTVYSDKLLLQLYQALSAATQKQSFAAELLVLILQLMHSSALFSKGDDSYREGYTVSLSKFLSAFIEDHSYINPVFYSYIGKVEETNECDREFELGYVYRDNSVIIKSDSLLCEVIGDNSNVYHVPLVYADSNIKNVICPPQEVVYGVRKLTPSGKIAVNGNICYKYIPTFSWVSSLSLASSEDTHTPSGTNERLGQSNNPLLDIFLGYRNRFDMVGESPKVFSVKIPGTLSFIGVQTDERDSIKLCRILDDKGVEIKAENGVGLLAEDNSIIVRYSDKKTREETVVVAEFGDYEVDTVTDDDSSDTNELPELETLLAGYHLDVTELFQGDNTEYLSEVARRICDLNALDYRILLQQSRNIIMRDLAYIVNVNRLDIMLGYVLIKTYFDVFTDGVLDSFNFATLKELCGFTLGEPNILTDADSMTPDLWERLKEEVNSYKGGLFDVQEQSLYSLNTSVLALQGCSRNEVYQSADSSLYYALHFIPVFHRMLSKLENQMVLVKALYEADESISDVLRTNSVIFSCYNAITTKESVGHVESNLKSGMRVKDLSCGLDVTKQVLQSGLLESYSVLKYFVLERNLFGVLTEMEEYFTQGDDKYKALYSKIRSDLAYQFDGEIRLISERDFKQHISDAEVEHIFFKYHSEFNSVVDDGLLSEVGTTIDFQVVKAYDILSGYGRYLFNLGEGEQENFTDTAEYSAMFYSYIGSFYLTFCPIQGEASDEIDGGLDRYTAYLHNPKDFKSAVSLELLRQFELRDLKLVTGLESGETLAAIAGDDSLNPEDL